MEITKNTWKTPSRPCNFSLCIQGGSVFADFNTDPDGTVFLVRISFDGYGCCSTEANIGRMTLNESRMLMESVAAGTLDRDEIRDIVRQYFQENDDVIWRDALEEYELINVR